MNTFIIIILTAIITYYVTLSIKSVNCISSNKNNVNCSIGNSTNNLQINRINSSKITINGKSYNGQTINVVNGKVMVDNNIVDTPNNFIFDIAIEGDVGSVDLGIGDIKVTGDITEYAKTGQGNITVEHGTVGGDAKTGQGDIKIIGTLHGNAKTGMGDISLNK